MTINDFAHIFYSNYLSNVDWGELEEILWMYEEKLFDLEKVRVAGHKEFLIIVNDIEKNRYKRVLESGDGIPHQALKLIAKGFLVKNFHIREKDVLYEQPFLGFEVDAIDRNLLFLTECGDTNASKFEKYLNSPAQSMIIFPYPQNRDVHAFIFTAHPKFHKYILHKKSYLLECLRDTRNNKK